MSDGVYRFSVADRLRSHLASPAAPAVRFASDCTREDLVMLLTEMVNLRLGGRIAVHEDVITVFDGPTDNASVAAAVEAAWAEVDMPRWVATLARTTVAVPINAIDFDHMTGERGRFDGESFRQAITDGFVHSLSDDGLISPAWQYIYVVPDWTSLVLCRAFLDHHGIPYQAAEDEHVRDGVLILTDYRSPLTHDVELVSRQYLMGIDDEEN